MRSLCQKNLKIKILASGLKSGESGPWGSKCQPCGPWGLQARKKWLPCYRSQVRVRKNGWVLLDFQQKERKNQCYKIKGQTGAENRWAVYNFQNVFEKEKSFSSSKIQKKWRKTVGRSHETRSPLSPRKRAQMAVESHCRGTHKDDEDVMIKRVSSSEKLQIFCSTLSQLGQV